MKNIAQNNHDKDIQYYLDLADRYDQLGLYARADEILQYLKKNYDNLPQEVKLRINDSTPHNLPGSMGDAEAGKGVMNLKGAVYNAMSGKGQACYRDKIPTDTPFI